jgi:hypothetical protein
MERRAARVTREVRALAELYSVDRAEVERVIESLEPWFERYAELVLTETGFEVITGGVGDDARAGLATAASRFGAPPAVVAAFVACAAAFPDRMLGLKIELGPRADGPTLYVRTMAPVEHALGFLASLATVAPAVPALRRALEPSRTLYGLGFFGQDGELGVKTYTIDDVAGDPTASRAACAPGFRSLRVVSGRMSAETKRYLPDVPWGDIVPPTQRWRAVADVARAALGCDQAAHFGIASADGRPPELKLYVERVGAIATDFAAR